MIKKMFAVTILNPKNYIHTPVFEETAVAIYSGLKALGYRAKRSNDASNRNFINIVLGANLLNISNIPLDPDAILYNLEQVDVSSPWFKDSKYMDALKTHRIWDYSEQNQRLLLEAGCDVKGVLPISYVPEWSNIKHTPIKDIDVLFYGVVNDKRKKILDDLRAKGVNVVNLFGVYGAKRDEHIARSKIVINIHYYSAKVLEMVRLAYLMANDVCIVSEESAEIEQDAELQKAICFGAYDELVDKVMMLLKNDELRQAYSHEAKKYIVARPITKHLPALIDSLVEAQ